MDGLFARKQENDDSVIPASSSSMARNLFRLGRYDSKFDWIQRSDRMLISAWENSDNIRRATGWASVLLWRTSPFYELAISGSNSDDMQEARKALDSSFYPQVILAGGLSNPDQPKWMEGKYVESGSARYFVCQEGACKLPVESLTDVDNLLKAE